jgi:hypothetical protein
MGIAESFQAQPSSHQIRLPQDSEYKRKSQGKDKKKGSQLVIRVDKAERDAFVTLCNQLDTSAAREIRRFMREMVALHTSEPVDSAVDVSGNVAVDDAGKAENNVTPSESQAVDTVAEDDIKKPRKKRKTVSV